MALDLAAYERKACKAVKSFWSNRLNASLKQRDAGRADQGERSGVTGGNNMNGFVERVIDIVKANGLAHAKIHQQRKVLTLPGYFRPTKLWDLVVIHKGELIAAVELKSHVGPSFGNNFNNRTEEAIGTGHDLWTALREGAFGQQPRPFVGWLMLVEDAAGSNSPVRDWRRTFPCSRNSTARRICGAMTSFVNGWREKTPTAQRRSSAPGARTQSPAATQTCPTQPA